MADLQKAAREQIAELVKAGMAPEDAALKVAKSVYASSSSLPGVQSSAAIAVAVSESSEIDFDAPTPGAAKPAKQTKQAAPRKKRTVADHLDAALAIIKQPVLPGVPGKGQVATRNALDDIADAVRDKKDTEKMVTAVAEMQQLEMSLFQIASWDDDLRGIPNDLARSAVFTTKNKNQKRVICEDLLIFHYNQEVEITYTGIELRADDDELVWMQILEYSKHSPLGTNVDFTLYQLCNDLGWHLTPFYYKRAISCLKRLKATCFTIKSPRYTKLKNLSLVGDFDVQQVGKKKAICTVVLDPYLVVLFANDHYSKVVWSKYRSLSPTARRLFDYFASHQKPYPLKLETFRLMCGSDSSRSNKWAEQSRQVCRELENVQLVAKTWVEKGFIHCNRELADESA